MDTNTNVLELQFDNSSQMLLRESAKWARFISIAGFVLCGIFVLIGVFAGTFFSTLTTNPYNDVAASRAMGGIMTVTYIAIAIVYFFPFLFLFRFGSRMQTALKSNDQQSLVNSLGNLRAYFRFVGILLIIGLAFCALAFIFGGLAAALSGK